MLAFDVNGLLYPEVPTELIRDKVVVDTIFVLLPRSPGATIAPLPARAAPGWPFTPVACCRG